MNRWIVRGKNALRADRARRELSAATTGRHAAIAYDPIRRVAPVASSPTLRLHQPAAAGHASSPGSPPDDAPGEYTAPEISSRQNAPHTLRRTFASIPAELNRPPRRAMYLIGHTDPTLTMRVYRQVIDMGEGGLQILEKLIGCTLDEASHCFPAGGFGNQLATGQQKCLPARPWSELEGTETP